MAKPVWCQYLRGRVRELSLSQYHFTLMHFCLCKPSASIRASNIHDTSWSDAWANTSKSVIESIQHLFGAITAIWIYQQAVQHSQFGCQEGIGNFRFYFGPVGGICLSMWQLLQTMYGYPVNSSIIIIIIIIIKCTYWPFLTEWTNIKYINLKMACCFFLFLPVYSMSWWRY